VRFPALHRALAEAGTEVITVPAAFTVPTGEAHWEILLRARAIGVLTMSDDKGSDDKIIAVHVDDPEYAHYRDSGELPPHRLKEIQRFFLDYKVLENKAVDVEDMRGRPDAERVIRDAMRLYQREVLPGLSASRTSPS